MQDCRPLKEAMRKQSKYRPKGVRIDAVSWVLSGMRPMRLHGEATMLRVKNHAAMKDMVEGRADRTTVDTLIHAMNMTEALSLVRAELGADWRAEITAAQDALFTMAQRGVSKGNLFRFTGPELTAMNLAMEIHDAQIDNCTIKELEKAMELIHHTIINKKARAIVRTNPP
jgi:hypothetical protein